MFRQLAPATVDPMFALDGTIYPVNENFDWSADLDVLTDAVRDTHAAMRMHQLALRTPDRLWLHCSCLDVAEHGRQLAIGHLSLVTTLTTLIPDVAHRATTPHRLPVTHTFLRMMQAVVVAFTSFHLVPYM